MTRSLPEMSRGKERKWRKTVKETDEDLHSLKTLVTEGREEEMGGKGKGRRGKRRTERWTEMDGHHSLLRHAVTYPGLKIKRQA